MLLIHATFYIFGKAAGFIPGHFLLLLSMMSWVGNPLIIVLLWRVFIGRLRVTFILPLMTIVTGQAQWSFWVLQIPPICSLLVWICGHVALRTFIWHFFFMADRQAHARPQKIMSFNRLLLIQSFFLFLLFNPRFTLDDLLIFHELFIVVDHEESCDGYTAAQ